MNNSIKFKCTRSEKTTLIIVVSVTFTLTFLLSTIVAHFDIKDELKEDASELLTRLESIHAEGAAIAKKLASEPGQTCNADHRHKMRHLLNQQFFIQSMRYNANHSLGCIVGEHASYENQQSISRSGPQFSDMLLSD